MSDRTGVVPLTFRPFGRDVFSADPLADMDTLNQRIRSRVADLEHERDAWKARAERLEAVARQAHAAMWDWHEVHGQPSPLMSAEEQAMGAACIAIHEALEGDE